MIGMALPGASDYAWAESDYLLNDPANTTGPLDLWGVGAEGLFSAQGQASNQDMYIVNANKPPIRLCHRCSRQCLHRRFGFLSSAATLAFFAGADGNVGLGTVRPGAKLEVNGNIMLTKGSTAGITFTDGTKQTTAFTGAPTLLKGGDYAESVDMTGIASSMSRVMCL